MPTPNEKKALYFLIAVVISGVGVRSWRAHASAPDARATLQLGQQLERVDSVRAGKRVVRRKRASVDPSLSLRMTKRSLGMTSRMTRDDSIDALATRPSPGAPVDLDRAAVSEIHAIPGISTILAARIVARRDSLGWLGSLDALCGVRGVDGGVLELLRPVVTFSGPRRPVSDVCGGASKKLPNARDARSRKRR